MGLGWQARHFCRRVAHPRSSDGHGAAVDGRLGVQFHDVAVPHRVILTHLLAVE